MTGSSGERPEGWFERLYAGATGASDIPWADLSPNAHLTTWLDEQGVDGTGRRAVTVGAGLGDDAEALVRYGFAVTAFDVAPTAVAWARRRFPDSEVDYEVADVLALPVQWRAAFDLVFEAYTLQSLPRAQIAAAAEAIGELLAPRGTLLVVASGRDDGAPLGPSRPWPLSPAELRGLFPSLELVRLEDDRFPGQRPARRLRAAFRQRDAG